MTTLVYAIDVTDLSPTSAMTLMVDLEDELRGRALDFETKRITNNYVVICDGDRHLDSTQAHANGTHVVTIKRSI